MTDMDQKNECSTLERMIDAAMFAATQKTYELDHKTLTRADFERQLADNPQLHVDFRAIIKAALEAAGTESAAEKEIAVLTDELNALEQEQCGYDDEINRLQVRAEAAEKRLAEAREVIEPLVNRYNEIMQITSGRRVASTYVEMDHLRAAAEWMEQNR